MDWYSSICLFLSLKEVMYVSMTCKEYVEYREAALLAYQHCHIPQRFQHRHALVACKRFHVWQMYHRLPACSLINVPLKRWHIRFLIHMYKDRDPSRVKMLKRFQARHVRNRVLWKVELWCK